MVPEFQELMIEGVRIVRIGTTCSMHPSAVISAQKIEVNRNRERWAKGREEEKQTFYSVKY